MATRGTYQFWSKHNPVITVYLHHDNYLKGAAVHLFNEVTEAPIRSVEEFIRINPLARITDDHSAHGDTDYRYDIFFGPHKHVNDRILAYERNFPKADLEESWTEVVNTTLEAFIDAHVQYKSHELDADALDLMVDRARLVQQSNI
jgi:hypothetical protein